MFIIFSNVAQRKQMGIPSSQGHLRAIYLPCLEQRIPQIVETAKVFSDTDKNVIQRQRPCASWPRSSRILRMYRRFRIKAVSVRAYVCMYACREPVKLRVPMPEAQMVAKTDATPPGT
jgi:hypothetical protein